MDVSCGQPQCPNVNSNIRLVSSDGGERLGAADGLGASHRDVVDPIGPEQRLYRLYGVVGVGVLGGVGDHGRRQGVAGYG